MLYVQEKVVKLGGIYLEGQVTSVEVQEAGSVYVAQDEKGRYKKSQPVGYENAKVMIDPDRLFGRHLAVLGNTGSGKSCSVAAAFQALWSGQAEASSNSQ